MLDMCADFELTERRKTRLERELILIEQSDMGEKLVFTADLYGYVELGLVS